MSQVEPTHTPVVESESHQHAVNQTDAGGGVDTKQQMDANSDLHASLSQ